MLYHLHDTDVTAGCRAGGDGDTVGVRLPLPVGRIVPACNRLYSRRHWTNGNSGTKVARAGIYKLSVTVVVR